MIKRANKITALLVLATSISTIVPAMATDTVKLGNKDEHVYSGISFKDGKYSYYGYRTDDDDTGIYYNNGSKDKDALIKDAEEYSFDNNINSNNESTTSEGVKYGDKYIIVHEEGNKDEYLIDLTTGKVADVDTPEDKEDSVKGKLISALKRAERYNQTSDSNYGINDNSVEFTRLFKNRFGDIWYQYATTSSSVTLDASIGAQISNGSSDSFGETTTGAAVLTGFVNENGKYIDASYTANLRVYNERKRKASIIEKFGKLYMDEALKVNLKGLKALAQDKDYIYALAKVDVIYYGKGSNNDYVYDDAAKTTKVKHQYFVQKLSKERGLQEEGAYLPKDVQSWQLDNGNNDIKDLDVTYENDGDRSDVAKAIINDAKNYSVINGNLCVTTTPDSKVKVWKIKLKNDKIKINSSSNLINNDDKIDTYIVTKDGDADTNKEDWSIDSNGNTWAIHNGEIKMFDDGDFKTKYRCDRSYNRIDAYDTTDLIAWDSKNDGAYTTVHEGRQQTVDDSKAIDPNLVDKTNTKVGWDQLADGTWNLYDATGAKIVNNWATIGGIWYYFNPDGSMATGWKEVSGNWYYLNQFSDGTKGSMKIGWINDNGSWYYLGSSGAMETGWIYDNGNWYYLSPNGAMAADTTIDGYTLSSSGALV